jgi:internalin A
MLNQLERLYLDGNALTALPHEMAQLKNLKELYLHGNEALGIPKEVLGPEWYDDMSDDAPANPQDILTFYLSR